MSPEVFPEIDLAKVQIKAASEKSLARKGIFPPEYEEKSQKLVWGLDFPQGHAAIVVTRGADGVSVHCESDDAVMRKLLRNAMVGRGLLVADPFEHIVLASYSPYRANRLSVRYLLRVVERWILEIQFYMRNLHLVDLGNVHVDEMVFKGFWWDRLPNFGDAVGPYIASELTGKQVVNVRATGENRTSAQGHSTALVGSIVHMVNRHNMTIWGSGLMWPLTEDQVHGLSKKKDITVAAVRGPRTREDLLEKLDWPVPEVYGDPALLLPKFLSPKTHAESGTDYLCVVPHAQHFSRLRRHGGPGVLVSNVRTDLRSVVDQIAGAKVCISTSLHGLIVAQAYGVPWVWLRITDSPLSGDDFKFEDFFHTVDREDVGIYSVASADIDSLDMAEIASRASIPRLIIDLTKLLDAFPAAAPSVTSRVVGLVRSRLQLAKPER